MTRARVRALLLVVLVFVALIGGGWLLSRSSDPAAAPKPESSVDATGLATPEPSDPEPDPVPQPKPKHQPAATHPSCPAKVERAFDPVDLKISGVVGRKTVLHPPRDAAGVPGTPPLSNIGKRVFAWDRENGIRPGDEGGNVLLNAHTYPDGSALGNQLLDALQRGDRIVVHGNGTRLCYRVTERLEVSAATGLARYYATDGRPQLAIVVCSGRRFGPGDWENRTIWFASPAAR